MHQLYQARSLAIKQFRFFSIVKRECPGELCAPPALLTWTISDLHPSVHWNCHGSYSQAEGFQAGSVRRSASACSLCCTKLLLCAQTNASYVSLTASCTARCITVVLEDCTVSQLKQMALLRGNVSKLQSDMQLTKKS